MSEPVYCQNVEDCLAKGKCTAHDVVEEKRRHTDVLVEELKQTVTEDKKAADRCHKLMDDRIDAIASRITGLAGSMGLMLIIVLGGYYYANIIDGRNNRGEEILLAKINADAKAAKDEREELVSQVVSLLTTDAEQRQWQKGMMRQLELLNRHIRDIVDLKNQINHPGPLPMYEED